MENQNSYRICLHKKISQRNCLLEFNLLKQQRRNQICLQKRFAYNFTFRKKLITVKNLAGLDGWINTIPHKNGLEPLKKPRWTKAISLKICSSTVELIYHIVRSCFKLPQGLIIFVQDGKLMLISIILKASYSF
jgi:hypothetical protein